MEPSWAALVATTAISVATVLGTGILALPVTLHGSGLPPFLLSFTLTLLAQCGVVYAMTELLQRAYALGPKLQPRDDYIPLPLENGAAAASPSTSLDQLAAPSAPSLHTISKLFLSSRVMQCAFEGFVLLHFVSIMVSYALAAPQVLALLVPAYGRLGVRKCTALFSGSASALIVLMPRVLYPLLTAATFVKGLLLSVLIALTLVLGARVGLAPSTHWGRAAVEPFLVGSLALSGVVNLMPVTFESCLRSCGSRRSSAVPANFVRAYRTATLLGVFICYLLNVGWCVAVLLIVPQDTLAVANHTGQNSTSPLIQALKRHGGNVNNTAAFLVNLFTAISVTVSFFVMGIGMKHTLDDQLKAFVSRRSAPIKRIAASASYYALFFGTIVAIALTNPHAFVRLLAGVTSASLNVEAGIFIVFMLLQSRRPIWNHTVLETSLDSTTVTALSISVGAYFVSAVAIDLSLYLLRR